ncbi:MAG: hydroxymethylglutaryl-CoA lyase [Bdellovibrionaceae bacterium]|nr:hydroxymethylglutaryl-CoA lyase [Pseudobdellovibrionaceae bacterium]
MKKQVRLIEVGPRDGLQNEPTHLSVEDRVELIRRLADAGLRVIEAGSFVSPKWVPQMADSAAVLGRALTLVPKTVRLPVLVPNERGLTDAVSAGAREISIFAACSESFSQANTNCSIAESIRRLAAVVELAKKKRMKIRGYLSVCFGCPFEGEVPEKKVVEMVKVMAKFGCYEVSIGDTIGVAHPGQVKSLFSKLKKIVPISVLAGHFHDTRGMAVANALMAWQMGVTAFDCSIGGLGGCPYAPGASGNVATEDLVYMFDGLGVKTGVKLEKLREVNRWVEGRIGRPLPSAVGQVGPLKPKAREVSNLCS